MGKVDEHCKQKPISEKKEKRNSFMVLTKVRLTRLFQGNTTKISMCNTSLYNKMAKRATSYADSLYNATPVYKKVVLSLGQV